jgi:hypothetical protein
VTGSMSSWCAVTKRELTPARGRGPFLAALVQRARVPVQPVTLPVLRGKDPPAQIAQFGAVVIPDSWRGDPVGSKLGCKSPGGPMRVHRGRSVQGASNFGGRSGSELIASSLPSTKSPRGRSKLTVGDGDAKHSGLCDGRCSR